MKEFVLSPPSAILYVAAGLLLVVVASVFLKQGPVVQKVVGVVITVLVVAGIVFFLYRPVTIAVDDEGIEVAGAGGLELAWDEVESAVFEPNLPDSGYRPTVRTRGTAVGDYRTGRFLLSNGNAARLFMERQDAAVVIRTDELTYLFAPSSVEELAAAIDAYRVYEGEDAQ